MDPEGKGLWRDISATPSCKVLSNVIYVDGAFPDSQSIFLNDYQFVVKGIKNPNIAGQTGPIQLNIHTSTGSIWDSSDLFPGITITPGVFLGKLE